MKMPRRHFGGLIMLFSLLPNFCLHASDSRLQALCEPFLAIKQLSAQTRRIIKEIPGGSFTTLSSVYFERPGKFHSEMISPVSLRAVSDGTVLKYHYEGTPSGLFARLEELPPAMSRSVTCAPGTQEETLKTLCDVVDQVRQLPPDDGFTKRLACVSTNENLFVTLAVDPTGRVAKVTWFDDASLGNERACTVFSDWLEVGANLWIPLKTESTMLFKERKVVNTLRLDNVRVNEPLAKSLFSHEATFRGVRFEPFKQNKPQSY